MTDEKSSDPRHSLIDFLSDKGFDLIGHSNSDQEKVANSALDEGEKGHFCFSLSSFISFHSLNNQFFHCMNVLNVSLFVVMFLKRLLVGSISLSEDSQLDGENGGEQSEKHETNNCQSTGMLVCVLESDVGFSIPFGCMYPHFRLEECGSNCYRRS